MCPAEFVAVAEFLSGSIATELRCRRFVHLFLNSDMLYYRRERRRDLSRYLGASRKSRFAAILNRQSTEQECLHDVCD
jgi:hypothetical protein